MENERIGTRLTPQRVAIGLCSMILIIHTVTRLEWQPIADFRNSASSMIPIFSFSWRSIWGRDNYNSQLNIVVRSAWRGSSRPGANNQIIAFSQMLHFMCRSNASNLGNSQFSEDDALPPRYFVVVPTIVSSAPYNKSNGEVPRFSPWASRGKPGDITRYLLLKDMDDRDKSLPSCEIIYYDEPIKIRDKDNPAGSGTKQTSVTCSTCKHIENPETFFSKAIDDLPLLSQNLNERKLESCVPCVEIPLQRFFHFPKDFSQSTSAAVFAKHLPFYGFTSLVQRVKRQLIPPSNQSMRCSALTPCTVGNVRSEAPFYIVQWRVKTNFFNLCQRNYPTSRACNQDVAELIWQLENIGVTFSARNETNLTSNTSMRSASNLNVNTSISRVLSNRSAMLPIPNVYLMTNEDRNLEMLKLSRIGMSFFKSVSFRFNGLEEHDLKLMAEMALAVDSPRTLLHPSSTFKFLVAGLRYSLGKQVNFYNTTDRGFSVPNLNKKAPRGPPSKIRKHQTIRGKAQKSNVLVGHHRSTEKIRTVFHPEK